MKIVIYRGASQVGGNCIEVSTAKTRLILDVGLPLEDPARPSSTPPAGRTIRPPDLPAVPGLFAEGPRVDAVLLSHAHSDHAGLLQAVRATIPICLSQGTSKMLMAGSMFAGQPQLDRKRERKLVPLKPTLIGDITVTALPVDHSAFDSLALLLEADGKRLLYSGDLRLHGRKPGMARQLLSVIARKPIDVLLMEGTNLRETSSCAPCGNRTEADLEDTLYRAINPCSFLVLSNFSPQHVDRMVSFYKAARRSRRDFVVDVYGALVLHLASGQSPGIPKPTGQNAIRVYYPQSFQQSWQKKNLKKIHDLFLPNRIDLPAILANPDHFVMLFRPSMLKSDFGGALPEHTICLYSYWPGYLTRPEYRPLQAALSKAGGDLLQCHTSPTSRIRPRCGKSF